MPSHKKKVEEAVSVEPVVEVPQTPVKKSKAAKTVSDPVVAQVDAKAVPKVKASSKSVKAAEPQEVVQDTQAIVPEMDNIVVTSDSGEHTSITSGFSDFITKFQSMLVSFNSLKTELRTLEKMTVKQLKVAEKLNNRKRRKGNRAPSGFVKPSLISDELAKFLDKPCGTEMARTDVTREINKYIRANNLQDKSNGRKINPDKPLTQLLKVSDSVELTYFNLQKYMGPHFPKAAKAEPPVATA
jgi:chromatin remodeling complex protein RSC6